MHLSRIAGKTGYSFASIGPEQTSYAGVSTNQLAGQHGVLSAKTGSTQIAGGCLVLARSMPGSGEKVILGILGSALTYDETWTAATDERWNDAIAVLDVIDAGWGSGPDVAATATEPPFANAQSDSPLAFTTQPESLARMQTDAQGRAKARLEPQQLAPAESEPGSRSGTRAEPLLAVTVAGGVLTLAAMFSWSRIAPSPTWSGARNDGPC